MNHLKSNAALVKWAGVLGTLPIGNPICACLWGPQRHLHGLPELCKAQFKNHWTQKSLRPLVDLTFHDSNSEINNRCLQLKPNEIYSCTPLEIKLKTFLPFKNQTKFIAWNSDRVYKEPFKC